LRKIRDSSGSLKAIRPGGREEEEIPVRESRIGIVREGAGIEPTPSPWDPYVPHRIRDGARPGKMNCVGCPDRVVVHDRRGWRRMACRIDGRVLHYIEKCPKLEHERKINGGDKT